MSKLDDPARRLLIQALSAGALANSIPNAAAQVANIPSSRGGRLPLQQSIYRISGTATVNDKPANLETRINPGDTVKTGRDSELVFVVNTNAMILRGNSNVIIESEKKGDSLILSGLQLLAGALLSVSRNTPMRVRTATATVGIRGTGFYLEADPNQTYFCTCYGTTEVASNAEPERKEKITSNQHDRPIYILQDGGKGKNIRDAPFINHSDLELTLIESLVGRTPPFIFPNDSYTAPRRNY